MVPRKGLEPPRISTPEPKLRMAGNSILLYQHLETDGNNTVRKEHGITVEARSRDVFKLAVLDLMTHVDPALIKI